ncbi:rho guanine nucleotide exchange factor 40 isoform X1 [Alosa pseudoharengus]|uniref:rho guanine nucleotide exchange factor 40 isoform X1 n=1 Tax=Alosa pseudoharengus TaxID=34774 RepID=UPI003F892CE8
MGSEAVEDCVQGALASLYPPFESTAPPLLSQVFSVLESTYQHDSLRYLLDYFIPAKHLLHRLQQHACSQYLGCLFLHSGWPLCLGEKVVVQLSTLDWRLLRSTDFYLQVVPFSTRCPRLALKCLAPGGRNVQEVLVPESQHPLVFTTEWLHSVNKERGCKRDGGTGALDTCLVSTGDGILRLPWVEVVYPKFVCNPQGEELGDLALPANPGSPSQLSSAGMRAGRGSGGGGGGGLGWGSSSGELDSWSWDEEDDDDDDGNDPDGTEAEAALVALARRRASADALAGRLGASASVVAPPGDREGDYVELLEPRGGPDGGADPSQQRYLEMHGVSKTRTLPLCRRAKAIKLRRGKAWAFGRTDASGGGAGGRSGAAARRDSGNQAGRDWLQPRPMPRVIDLGRERRNHPAQDLDVEERYVRDPTGLDSRGLYLGGPAKERRPGVGREREGVACTLPWEESQRCKGSASSSSRGGSEAQREEEATEVTNHKGEHTGEGQSDQGSHSDSVFEDTDKQLADYLSSEDCPSKPLAETTVNPVCPDKPLAGTCREGKGAASQTAGDSECCDSASRGTPPQTGNTKENSNSERTHSQPGTDKVTEEKHCGKSEERVCPRGKEVKSGGFRVPRRKRKVKGGKGKCKYGARGNQKGKDPATPKSQNKAPQNGSATTSATKLPLSQDNQSKQPKQSSGPDNEPPLTNENGENEEEEPKESNKEDQAVVTDSPPDADDQGTPTTDQSSEVETSSTLPDQSNGESPKAPPLLRDLDQELLQSGKLLLTGTVDRLGRGLVVTEAHLPEEGYQADEMTRVLACYYHITRLAAKEKGLTVIIDSRQAPPTELCLSALKSFKTQVPEGLASVLILTDEQQESSQPALDGIEVRTVRGTGVLQQFVDRQQLTTEMDGDCQHSHSDWLTFRLSLERLTERCESALSLLEDALQSMEKEPLPASIKTVTASVDKHRQLMTSVLADQRLTELQCRGGAWLAGLSNGTSGLAQRSPDCRAALAMTSKLYDSVDDALHNLVQVSNQKGRDLEALGRLAGLVDKLDKCEKEIGSVQEQLEDFRDPPLSLSRLSLKQQKFKSFRESAMELNRDTLAVLGEVEGWGELEWPGLPAVIGRLPPVREKLRDMSHCLSDCWTQLDNTQRLLSTLTEASQWCDVVSSSSPSSSSLASLSSSSSSTTSSSPLSSLPPIPPSRFQDARALALELGGGPLLDLWSQTLERYQQTLAQFKSRLLQAERGGPLDGGPGPARGGGGAGGGVRPLGHGGSSVWELLGGGGGDGESGEVAECWGSDSGGGGVGLQSWGSLASLFRPQNCSTLRIGEERRKDGGTGGGGGAGGGGGKFFQALRHPAKKSPTEAPLPPKPPRKRHPSFDLQALLAPRRTPTPAPAPARPAETPVGPASRNSPLSWLGRRALADPVLTAGMAAAVPGWREREREPVGGGGVGGGGGGGGVLIRGVEVSSKEVADHTGLSRQHVLLSRAERETGGERQGTTAQSKLYMQWCRLVNSERQYVSTLRGVEEHFLPQLEGPDAPAALRGQAPALFSNWSSLCAFHTQYLLPAMEGALTQTLQQQDCFIKYREQFLLYSHYIHTKPDLDSLLVSQATEFFKLKLSSFYPHSVLAFPGCLRAPEQRLEQYCEALEELSGLNPNPAPDAALAILRHAQQHGQDLRASDLITGCPVPVSERGELVRFGELLVCGGPRRRKSGLRSVFLFQHHLIFTKQRTPSPGRTAYSFKHSIKTGEMGLTQSVGEDGLKFEVWVRQAPRTRDCLTLQAHNPEDRAAWAHDVAQLLWTHAINNTELCLKETLCVGVSSKLLLDFTGAPTTEMDSTFSLNDRVQSSCSDSSSVGSQKEGGSPSSSRDSKRNSAHSQSTSPSTAV